MRLWVFALLVLGFVALGGVVGVLAGRDPGYVLLTYDRQSVETSLWFALALLGLFFALLLLTGFALVRLLGSGVALGRWSRRRRRQLAAARTQQGMLLLQEDEWSEARRLLEGAAEDAPVPLLNYLCAARAAHNLGEQKERDRLLLQAERSNAGAQLSVQLVRAELYVADAELKPAIELLEGLKVRDPQHPRVLTLLAQAYERTENWRALTQLLPGLRKARSIPKHLVDQFTLAVARAELAGLPAEEAGVRARERLWKRLPKQLHGDAELAVSLARCAERQGELASVAKVVSGAIDHAIADPARAAAAALPLQELVALYGAMDTLAIAEREAKVRGWLSCRQTAGSAQLALGRLRVLAGDSKAARELLEGVAAVNLATEQRTVRTAALELARVQLARGDLEAAADVLERGFAHLRPVTLAAIASPSPPTLEVTAETPTR